MRFLHKNNEYELYELVEPNRNETADLIGIFKVKYMIYKGLDKYEVSKDEYDASDYKFEELVFINFFYGADDEDEVLIKIAKSYIEEEEQCNHK